MAGKEKDMRALALETLTEWEKTSAKLDALVHEKLERHQDLPENIRGFYSRLTFGTVGDLIKLDHVISAYSNVPVRKLKPAIRNILRLSAYQLLEMKSVPASAAVNEAVKLAVSKGFAPLKGFVNGVLRNIVRQPEKVVWPGKDDPVRYINIMYSIPEYLAGKWVGEYGLEKTEDMCRSFAGGKKITIRIRSTRNDISETLDLLEREGVKAVKADGAENAYFLEGRGRLEELKAFEKGLFYVQDLSSQMSIEAADIKEGDSVLDLCASPGGKTMTAADILAGSGRVEARDISQEKVVRIIENISRCGFENVNASVHDACIFDPSCERAFDVVIADVPCSGYGVIGKKPDIKYGVSKEKETELIKIQRQILDTACRYVRPGGTLVFSTCTVNREENAENAAWFVRNHEGFEKVFEEQLLPDEFHDGFYTARFIYGH